MKKSTGTLLVIVGLILGGWGLYEQEKEITLLDVGGLEIKKDRSKHLNWMMIGGASCLVLGVIIVATTKK